jgi:hypothetical protein
MLKTSYGEQLCRRVCKTWFPDKGVIYNYRPLWLQNPKTGKNLELDIYYPDLKLAIEFNGIQHNLLLQKEKDYFKKQQCIKVGIVLLSIFHPLELLNCRGIIKRHTGIKTKVGSANRSLVWELKSYLPNESIPSWYIREKEISDNEVARRDEKRRIRKQNKVILRDILKILLSKKYLTKVGK